ncbi:MAG: transcriptional regulator, LacI family [Bacilli bacterium]|jgi:LacI family transcriptional regulator|nr:transcriptional regulator, LacI family [Bacilli bacterium]
MEVKKIKLKDVAQRTGFTINTVSRALKNKEEISLSTRKVIQETAKVMGYFVNTVASSLRSGFTKSIAVIIGDISNPHFGITVKEIEILARKRGYTIFIITTEEDDHLEEKAIQSAISQNVDGIIICPTQRGIKNIRFLQKTGIPFVLLGRRFENEHDIDYVVCDDVNGGYIAIKHLLDRGRKKILFLNGPSYISSAKDRLQGYKLALQEARISFDPALVREIGVTSGDSQNEIKKLLLEGIAFDGIFAFSDMMAWEAIHMLNLRGFSVPKDFSVVGFDNIQSRFFFPMLLTTVSNSKSTMSRRTIDILLRKIKDPLNKSKFCEILETRLIIREST